MRHVSKDRDRINKSGMSMIAMTACEDVSSELVASSSMIAD